MNECQWYFFSNLIASKCFQCNGMTKNEECNQQGIASCEPGQGCTTTIIQGKIYKGCSYPADDYKDDTMNLMTCYGSWCNQPLMTTHKGKDGYWWKFLYTLFTRYSMAFIKHWLLNMWIFQKKIQGVSHTQPFSVAWTWCPVWFWTGCPILGKFLTSESYMIV